MNADRIILVDFIFADPGEQFGEGDPGFHPGQVRAEAEVRTAAEAQQIGPDLAPDDEVVGTFRRRLNLSSGRFAMIDDGLGFSLVPWSPSMERQLDRHVSGIVRADGGVDWSFRRTRDLGL